MPTNFESWLPSGYWKAFDRVWWKLGELPEVSEPEPEPIDEELETTIETLESDINSLASQIAILNSKISNLENQISNLPEPVAPNQTISYVAVVLALLAVIVAYYFGTKTS